MADLVAIDPPPCDGSVIDLLEVLLARARGGEISSVAAAWVLRDGRMGSTWSASTPASSLAGSIARLEYRYHTQLHDELEP